VIDYLDKPPPRYSLSYDQYLADPCGAWVKFTDMDLYMFEGGQLMLQSAARITVLETALRKIAALRVDSPSPIGPLHGAGISQGFDICRQIANEALGSPVSEKQGGEHGQ